MTTIRTATMRVLALLALAAVAIAVLLIVSASDSGDKGNRRQPAQQQQGQGKKNRGDNDGRGQQARKFYIVQSGDTLSSIAEETGTTVDELQELNPDIDPQILVSGQKLKLR
jgi:LysM repeat protein